MENDSPQAAAEPVEPPLTDGKPFPWEAVHWSSIGEPDAPDRAIMDWARRNQHVIFTHDLDFGTALALTHDEGPSVVQVRTKDVLQAHLEGLMVMVLRQHEEQLRSGALVVVDEGSSRVRILPIHGR
jgi:predicted nuclease of predicted toxin-antitoxin system